MPHRLLRLGWRLAAFTFLLSSAAVAQGNAPARVITWTGSASALDHVSHAWADYFSGNNLSIHADEFARLAFSEDSSAPRVRAVHAMAFDRTEEWPRATQEALAHGSLGELLLVLAWRERAAGHPDQALALAKAAAELYPDDPIAASEVAYDSTVGKGAARVADALVEVARRTKYPAAVGWVVPTLLASGDTARALALAEEFDRSAPQMPEAHIVHAKALIATGDMEGAMHHAGAALDADPSFSPAHIQMAELLELRGDFDGARTHIGHAVDRAITPEEKASLARSIAVTYAEEGKYPDALRQLQQAAAAMGVVHDNTQLAVAERNAALVYAIMNQPAEVTAHLANAARAEATGLNRSYWECVVNAEAGLSADADSALQTYVRTAGPTPSAPEQSNIHMLTGAVLLSQNRPVEALQHLAQANQQNIYARLLEGRAHKKLGHSQEAAVARAYVLGRRDLVTLYQFPGAITRNEARKL